MATVKFEYNGKLADGRYWDEDSKKKVLVELEDNDLTVSEMLEEFMNFMQAIGYKFELGDRFNVVNDFNTKTDSSDTKTNEPAPWRSAPAVSTPTVSADENYTKEQLADEIIRLKSMTMGVSDEAIEIAARNNLKYKDNV